MDRIHKLPKSNIRNPKSSLNILPQNLLLCFNTIEITDKWNDIPIKPGSLVTALILHI